MLTLNEAANTLGVSTRTIQRKAKSGVIERVITTKGVRYVVADTPSNIRRRPMVSETLSEYPDVLVEEVFHLQAELESLRKRVATQAQELNELRGAMADTGLFVRPK